MIEERIMEGINFSVNSEVYNLLKEVAIQADLALSKLYTELDIVELINFSNKLSISFYCNVHDFEKIRLHPNCENFNTSYLFEVPSINGCSYKSVNIQKDIILHFICLPSYKGEITCNLKEVFK